MGVSTPALIALYKSGRDLPAARASAALIISFDDHVDDNWADAFDKVDR